MQKDLHITFSLLYVKLKIMKNIFFGKRSGSQFKNIQSVSFYTLIISSLLLANFCIAQSADAPKDLSLDLARKKVANGIVILYSEPGEFKLFVQFENGKATRMNAVDDNGKLVKIILKQVNNGKPDVTGKVTNEIIVPADDTIASKKKKKDKHYSVKALPDLLQGKMDLMDATKIGAY